MKIILSAFECNPYTGSDSYLGWTYVLNMARFNEVYALTRIENKNDIERYCGENDVPQKLHFVYVERSQFFAKHLYKLNPYLGFLGSYYVWQKAAYKKARELCKNTDISLCHHVSIADFRCAGYLWKLKKPFIFGPVGGGQETPECLSYYIKGHEKEERIRSFLNKVLVRLPNYRKALKRAAAIYSSNEETTQRMMKCLPEAEREKVFQLTELCIEDQYIVERSQLRREKKDIVRIIVSGRLIYRKGIALLIDAVQKISTDVNFVVDIYGEGDQKETLIRMVKEYGIESHVKFHGKVAFEEIQQRYKEADIFVLPSLRETTGTALLEAMANKLPVIALNQNGAKLVVTDNSGILINVNTRDQIIADLAAALTTLIEDYALRCRLGENGYSIIRETFSWDKRMAQMNEVYKHLCSKE